MLALRWEGRREQRRWTGEDVSSPQHGTPRRSCRSLVHTPRVLAPKRWSNSLCLQTSRVFGNKLLILLFVSIVQDSFFISEGIFMFMPIIYLYSVYLALLLYTWPMTTSLYKASVMKFNPPTLAFNVAFYQIADSNCCQLLFSHPSLSHFDSAINTPMFYLLKHYIIFIHEIKWSLLIPLYWKLSLLSGVPRLQIKVMLCSKKSIFWHFIKTINIFWPTLTFQYLVFHPWPEHFVLFVDVFVCVA